MNLAPPPSLPPGVDPEKAELIFARLVAAGGALEGVTRLVAVSSPALLPRFDLVLDLSVRPCCAFR